MNIMIQLHLKRLLCLILLLFINCRDPFWSHGEVDTFATLYLPTIMNNTEEQVKIEYIKPKELRGGDWVLISSPFKIKYESDNNTVSSQSVKTDTFSYEFTSVDYCYLTKSIANIMRINLSVYQNDSVINQTVIFPWDTLISGEKLDNCHKISWDTLRIE